MAGTRDSISTKCAQGTTKYTFPRDPLDFDWSALSIDNQPTVNGHIECRYFASKQSWTVPRFVQDPLIPVHGLAPGLNYGQQVYEGLKAFRTVDNRIHIFRPVAHAERLRNSAKMVRLPEVPDEIFLECIRLAVIHNVEFIPPGSSEGFLYIRPLLFGAGPQLVLAPPDEFILAIYVAPAIPYHGKLALDALVLDEFDRSAPRGTGRGKLGGNYSPLWPYQEKAKEGGFGIILHLDSETRSYIEEFSTSAFIGIGPNRTIHIPESANTLNSVTSDSIATLAMRKGWTVCRRKIPFTDIINFTEIFAVGTAATAVSIRSIYRPHTNEKHTLGYSDYIATGFELIKELVNIQRGLQIDNLGWCWNVSLSPQEY